MIQSTSSSNGTIRTDAVSAAPFKSPSYRLGADQLSTDKTELVRAALARQPEVRPEVVERGRALAADPAYPSADIMRRVSETILRSPDLSVDPS